MTSSLGVWAEGPTHQSQKAADLLDGADAAQEAHEHGDGAHADEDVGAHIECVGGGLCGETVGCMAGSPEPHYACIQESQPRTLLLLSPLAKVRLL